MERRDANNAGDMPDVIVDFVFDEGLFFIAVENIGNRPAYRVSATFDPPLHGLGGGKRMTEMALFRNIEFLAPHKRIVTFLDSSSAYFSREEPTRITIQISYHDRNGKRYRATIRHDLEIYRDLGYVRDLDVRSGSDPDEP